MLIGGSPKRKAGGSNPPGDATGNAESPVDTGLSAFFCSGGFRTAPAGSLLRKAPSPALFAHFRAARDPPGRGGGKGAADIAIRERMCYAEAAAIFHSLRNMQETEARYGQ